MKKAKALFAGAMIVLVAGTSAVFWYLNDRGIIGDKKDAVSGEYVVSAVQNDDDPYYYNEKENNAIDSPDDDERDETENSENKTTAADEKNDDAQDDDADDVSYEAINTFLSNFSLVYFSEASPYSTGNSSTYELIRFAYAHTRRTDPGSLVTKQESDEIEYYSGISYETVNTVLQEYLGVTVDRESVYTEKNYAFFRYEDGYFYTPAADGVGYSDLVILDSAVENGDATTVSFTVYSDGVSCDMTAAAARENGEKYASGSARLKRSGDGYILLAYEIKK